jgi:hypothetical protein
VVRAEALVLRLDAGIICTRHAGTLDNGAGRPGRNGRPRRPRIRRRRCKKSKLLAVLEGDGHVSSAIHVRTGRNRQYLVHDSAVVERGGGAVRRDWLLRRHGTESPAVAAVIA